MVKTARSICHWLLLLLLASSPLPPEVLAGPSGLFAPSRAPSIWRLQAEQFTYDELQGLYMARGNVQLRSATQYIRADKVRLDPLTHEAILEGGVRIEQGPNWLEGSRAVLDLEEQRGAVEQARGFLAENHFYFSGTHLEKLGAQTYHLKEASFTTCDGEPPSWHFRAHNLRISVDGYGYATHARFYAGPVPLLYFPYLVFPAKRKRQSGLLPPRLGRSELLGYDLDLPFFWAITESADATFYAHYMSKRGLMPGVEVRYASSERGKGVLRFDYLSDQEEDEELRRQSFREISPGFSGRYRNRWWWRSKQDFGLPGGVQGKLDLDFVSDRDYLREFKTGFSSFTESNNLFEKTFGRGLLNDETITTRESTLQLSKNWAAHSLNTDFHYFYNLNRAQDETTLQQLPRIDYSASRQPLLAGPLFFQADASYVNYWRQEGTRGQRLDLHPRLAWPLHLRYYLNLEPSVGLRETAYLIDRFDEPEDSPVERKHLQSRELYDVRVEASSEVMRVFGLGLGPWTKTKHTLRPEIVYEYVPLLAQDKFPYFDATDRLARKNLLSYSVTNFLVARLDKGPGKVSYLEFARLKLSQSYDFNKSDSSSQRAFSNLALELDVYPQRYLRLTYQSEWSPYDGDFKRHELLADLWDERGDTVGINYRQKRDEEGRTTLAEIDGSLNLNLWNGITFYLRSNYSFERKENLETDYVIQMNRQCWGVSLSYIEQPDNRRFMIGFTLYGLGGLRPQVLSSRD